MTEKELSDSFRAIVLTAEQKHKMLQNLLAARVEGRRRKRWKPGLSIVVACCALLIVWFAVPAIDRSSSMPPLVQQTTPMDPRVGMRKMMNYDGYRYAFLENGAEFDLSKVQLTEKLGVLEYDIEADIQQGAKNGYANQDFASTYALGGEIYSMGGYHKSFRVAVKAGETYYIAQVVGRTDNMPLSVQDYFQNGEFAKRTAKAEVLNHSGSRILHAFDHRKELQKFIEGLSASAEAAHLQAEDYQTLSKAQSSGKSFMIRLRLKDATVTSMYVVPELRLVSIGDGQYKLSDRFLSDFAKLFASLQQNAAPLTH